MEPYGPYDDMDERLRPLVGLDGPAVSVTVSGAEVDTLRQMVTALSTLSSGCRISGERVLRELDVRHGAAAALQPDKPLPAVKAPLSAAELDALRRCHTEAVEQGVGLRPQVEAWTRIVRALDRRFGAAQAAAAERAAAGAVEHLDQGQPGNFHPDAGTVEPDYPELVDDDPLDVERDIADGLGHRAEQLAAARWAADQPRPLTGWQAMLAELVGLPIGAAVWLAVWFGLPAAWLFGLPVAFWLGLVTTMAVAGPVPGDAIRSWRRRAARRSRS